MPTYDYECAACGRRFEVVHGVHAEGPTACPLCGKGPVRKVITAANVHYKGSGWAKKERRATVSAGASKGGEDGAKDGSKGEVAASSDADGTGSSPKKSERGSAGSSRAGASKATEKSSTSSASKTAD